MPANPGTYTGTYSAITITVSPATIASGAEIDDTIDGGIAIQAAGTASQGLVNDGRIYATGLDGIGIEFASGSIANQAGGLIEAAQTGIEFTGTGTLDNAGTIAPVGTGAITDLLLGGGVVINSGLLDAAYGGRGISSTGTIAVTNSGLIETANGSTAIYLAAGSIANSGTISAAATGGTNVAIFSTGDASVSNAATGWIGGGTAIELAGIDTVVNAGTIDGYLGVDIASGIIINSGLIEGRGGVYFSDGSLTNTGTVVSDQAYRNAVLGTDVAITNGTAGLIAADGQDSRAVNISGGYLLNQGTIEGPVGIQALSAATVIVNAGGATISAEPGSGFGIGVYTAGTLINHGYIVAGETSVEMLRGGVMTNASGGTLASGLFLYDATATNLSGGVITAAGTAIDIGYGTIASGFVNFGTVGGATATDGIFLNGKSTIINDNLIEATNGGIVGRSGGIIVVNQAAGTIEGYTGVDLYAANAATVVNHGLVDGRSYSGHGVDLDGGSVVDNDGTILGGGLRAVGVYGGYYNYVSNAAGGYIAGGKTGIDLKRGSVVNAGTIIGTLAYGIHMAYQAIVTNRSGGLIEGGVGIRFGSGTVVNEGVIAAFAGAGDIGIEIGGAAYLSNAAGAIIEGGIGIEVASDPIVTIVDAGTIEGTNGTAILFGSAQNLLIAEAGAVFIGKVDGYTGNSTLELAAGAGSLSGIGTNFVNFRSIDVDAGGAWTIGGTNTIGAGSVVSDQGALTFTGTLGNDGGIDVGAAGTLIVTGPLDGRGVVQVDGGVIALDGAMAATETIGFLGDSTLVLADPLGVLGQIENFLPGDTIDLTGVSYQPSGESFHYSGHHLVVVENGATVADLYFTGGGTQGTAFDLVSDGDGGTDIVRLQGVYAYSYSAPVTLSQSTATLAATGTVACSEDDVAGIYGSGTAFTVHDDGLIQMTGKYTTGIGLVAGGTVIVGGGAVIGATGTGIYLGNGGYVDNSGYIDVSASSGGTTLTAEGVRVVDLTGTVTNSGTIIGAGDAVYLGDGGTVENLSGGHIEGSLGVRVVDLIGTVLNSGTIEASGTAVYLGAGGLVDNEGGVIEGPLGVRVVDLAGTVRNSGSIVASGTAVYLGAGGLVENSNLIEGGVGIVFGGTAGGTLIDSGIIRGTIGDAVQFGAGDDRLIVDVGAGFFGQVDGGGGGNTLELAAGTGVGTLAGFATGFTNFAHVAIDAGAAWSLYGTIGSATAFVNDGALLDASRLDFQGGFTNSGSVYVDGGAVLVDEAALAGTGRIVVANHGTVALRAGGTGTIQFTDATGLLQLAAPIDTGLTLSGLVQGDLIDLTGVTYSTADTATYKNHQLIVYQNGSVVADLTVDSFPAGATIALSGDGGGGTDLEVATQGTTGLYSATYASVTLFHDPATITATGRIVDAATGGIAVYGYGAHHTLVAGGTIEATGSAGIGIALTSTTGIVTNQAGGLIDAAGTAVELTGRYLSLANAGIIEATGLGVSLAGGALSNASTGRITGTATGIATEGGASIANAGYIGASSGVALSLASGGVVTNSGTIEAARVGVAFTGIGSLANSGLIDATGSGGIGVQLFSGNITNLAGGVIEGSIGVEIQAGRLVDAGTIASSAGAAGYAVELQSSAAALDLDPGATLVGRVLGGGGTLELSAGTGTLAGLGTQYAGFGAVVVDAGATWTLAGGNSPGAATLTDNGLIELSGGSLADATTLEGAGTIALSAGAVLHLEAGAAGGIIEFLDATGTLALDQPLGVSAAIAGIVQGDVIDLTGVSYSATADSVTYTNHRLTVFANGVEVADLDIVGAPSGDVFMLRDDGHGGTEVIEEPPCFLAGTRILTDRGEIPVECLAEGDRVITRSGRATPIIWIGRRRYQPALLRDGRESVLPIVIQPGALGEHTPRRTLRVSPEHCLHLAGSLVPARLLVNGATIRQRRTLEPIEYVHIELAEHDIVTADGAPAETYRENGGNRAVFANAGDRPPRECPPCAPLLWDGAALGALRESLARRAAALGFRVTHDPGLHLLADGVAVAPAATDGTRYRFALSRAPAELRLRSRVSVPAEMLNSADRRRLGVNLAGIALRRGPAAIALDHRDPRLARGFHAPEPTHRWTDGDAVLPVPAGDAPLEIEIRILDRALPYWEGAGTFAAQGSDG
jgi:hypothetical protein